MIKKTVYMCVCVEGLILNCKILHTKVQDAGACLDLTGSSSRAMNGLARPKGRLSPCADPGIPREALEMPVEVFNWIPPFIAMESASLQLRYGSKGFHQAAGPSDH